MSEDSIYKLRLKQDIKIGELVDKLFADDKYEELFTYLFSEYPGMVITDVSMSSSDMVEHVVNIRRIHRVLVDLSNNGAIAKDSLKALNNRDIEDEL